MDGRSHGFTLVEVLILVAVASVVGLSSWYVWKRQIGAPSRIPGLPVTAQASIPEAYTRTTVIPANWKTYTNSDHGLTLSYPPTWTVTTNTIPKTVGYDYQNAYSKDASEIFVVCYLPPGWKQSCAAELNINNQAFDKSLTQARTYASRFMANRSEKMAETRIKLDSWEAVAIATKQTDDAPTQKDYYVSANKGTYVLPTVYDADPQDGGLKGVLTAKDSLMLFESVTIEATEQ